MMGIAEGQIEDPHAPVGQIGCSGETLFQPGQHTVRAGLHIIDHASGRCDGQGQGFYSIKQRFLIFLHILTEGHGQPLHHRRYADKGTQQPPGFCAHQFCGIGVFLLRHDGRPGGEGIAERDECETVRHPHHDFFGQTAEMDRMNGPRSQEFQNEITAANAVHGIGGGSVKTQGLGGHLAINGEGSTGQRGCAQRALIQAPTAIRQSSAVPSDHFDIGHKVVTERHRLGALQMGIAWHKDIGMGFGLVDQGALKICHQRVQTVQGVTSPQAHIGDNLVVAAASGMQARTGIADLFAQPGFHIHVDIFQFSLEIEGSRLDFMLYLSKALMDRIAVFVRDDALGGQHVRMCQGPLDVLFIEVFVETDGGVDLFHDFRRTAREPTAPHIVLRHTVSPLLSLLYDELEVQPVTNPVKTSPLAPTRRDFGLGACAIGLTALAPSILHTRPVQAAADYPPTNGEMQEFVLLKERAPAPVTPFFDGDGVEHHFTDFTGKVLLVNFWATWCAPCIKEMPSLARLNDVLAGPNFRLLTISQDRGGKAVAEPFLRDRLGLSDLELFYDPKLKLGWELGLRGLPSTYLIDQQGHLVGGLAGAAEWDSPEAIEMIKFVMLQGGDMQKTEDNSST